MNIDLARRVLDEHKERQCHSMLTVNRALFICGDLREMDESLFEVGERPCMESPHLVESERLGL
jgi:hypothetical protein